MLSQISFVIRLLLICLSLTGMSSAAGVPGSVTVAWNANPEANLSGYRLVYGTSSTNLDRSLVVGTVTTAVLAGLETGTTYYCAVQAFNTASLYSSLSPSISFVVPEILQPVIAVRHESTGTALGNGDGVEMPLGGGTERFIIRNSGNAALTGLRVSVDGPEARDFPPSSPSVTTLQPGESTTIRVQFQPSGTGMRSAVVHLSADGLAAFDIAVAGEGIPVPEIAVEQPSGYDLVSGAATVHFQSAIGEYGNTEVFTIRNVGTAPLAGLAVTARGMAADFEFTQPEVATLAPGASTTFQVVFAPTVAGIRTATLLLASNDADESPFLIQLEGNGPSVPEISVSRADSSALTDAASTVGFGNIALGAMAETQILTITNTGDANITGLAITTDGLHIGDFTVGSPGATFLRPGTSTTFRVSFQPSAAGVRTASVHIASNDADENPFDITLTGTGIVQPDISVSRADQTELTGGVSRVAFANTHLGASSATETLTINNLGTAPLTGLAVSLSGVHAGDFILNAPVTDALSPYAGTSFKVTFRPTTSGTRTATLHVASNDPDENPFIITLTGTGVAVPEIGITRADNTDLVDGVSSIGLGSVNLGSSGAVEVLTIRNTGTAALTGLAVTVTGSHAADFLVTTPAVATVAPGATTTFRVTFRPTAAGARTAGIVLSSNDADENPFNISLTGTGVAVPEIAIIRADSTNLVDGGATIGFGSVNLGSATSTETLTIRNTGTATLSGISVSITGSQAADFVVTGPANNALAPGASTTFGVVFRPAADGPRSSVIRVSSNDADENPFEINLSGHGIAIPIVALEDGSGEPLAPGAAILNFPDILVGGTTGTQTVVVKNTGTATLTGLLASLSGTHGNHFVLTAPTVSTLAPGASTSLQVAFSPLDGGGKTASLLINSSATPGAPLVVGLAGNALTAPEIVVFENSTELTSGSGTSGFGSMTIGSTSTAKVFTIRNLGSAPLSGLAVRSGSGDFIAGNPSAATLPPGGSTTFRVSFRPSGAGTRATTITLASNDADENPFTISLAGTGVAVPEIVVNNGSGKNLIDGNAYLNFGGVLLEGKSGQTVTIRNAGSATLQNLSVSRYGQNSGEFTVSALRTRSLAPGASTSIRITFNPSKAGIRWGGIRIFSNDANEKDFDIVLTGTGKNKSTTKGGNKKKKKPKQKTNPAKLHTPEVAASSPVKGIQVINGKKYRTLTLSVTKGKSFALRDIEVSGNLTGWSSGRGHVVVLRNTGKVFKVRDKVPLTADQKRYIRLKR